MQTLQSVSHAWENFHALGNLPNLPTHYPQADTLPPSSLVKQTAEGPMPNMLEIRARRTTGRLSIRILPVNSSCGREEPPRDLKGFQIKIDWSKLNPINSIE